MEFVAVSYKYELQLQNTFFCDVLLSRVEHVLLFQMGNVCHPASCQHLLLSSKMRCPHSIFSFQIIQKRTLDNITLCEGKEKTLSWTVDKYVPLHLILQEDSTACGLFACIILFLGIANLKSEISISWICVRCFCLISTDFSLYAKVLQEYAHLTGNNAQLIVHLTVS